MAFTIHQQPAQYTPAYNNNIFVVGSTNSAQPNFQYIAKVYVGSDIITVKKFPDNVYSSTYFDFGSTVEQLVTSDIDKTTYGFRLNANSNSTYYVEFYEEFNGVVSALQATSNTIRIFNAEIDFVDYATYDIDNYSVDGATLGTTLNHSLVRDIELNQDAWLHFISGTVSSASTAIITTYNSANTLLGVYKVANSFQTNGTAGHHFARFTCGTRQLDLISGGSITTVSGTLPMITSSVAYYNIYISDGTLPTTSVAHRFNIVDADCIHETFRLHYLNNLGAFESFNFTKANVRTETITREKYKSIVGGLTSSSAYSYGVSDVSTKVFSTVIKDKYAIQTDWISQSVQNVLEQLVSSPLVYWDSARGLININIEPSSFEFASNKRTKMIQLKLNFELSYDRYRQRY